MAEVKKEKVEVDLREKCSITLNERGYIFYDDGELVADETVTTKNCFRNFEIKITHERSEYFGLWR